MMSQDWRPDWLYRDIVAARRSLATDSLGRGARPRKAKKRVYGPRLRGERSHRQDDRRSG